MTLDSDVLRWMAMADQAEDKKPEKKKRWKNVIKWWQGQRATGEWIRESVATDVKRRFKKHTHGAESTKRKPVIVEVEVEEIVYAHQGFRPRLDGEKDTRKSFWFRGARVWRE